MYLYGISQHASMSELLNIEDRRRFILLLSTRETTYVRVVSLKSMSAIGSDELYIVLNYIDS